MTLQALRLRSATTRLLPRPAGLGRSANRYGVVSTADLVRLSERISGEQLDGLFDTWLYTAGKPARP